MPVGQTLYKSLYWKALQFGTSFIVNILLARTFQSAISAEFYALVYLLSLGISFFTLGLDISLSYYLVRNELSPAMARRIIVVIVLLALLVCLSLLRLFYQPSRYPDLGLSQLLLLSGFNIAGGLLTALSGTLFTAYGQNHTPGKVAFIINGILVAGCFIIGKFSSGLSVVDSLFWIYFVFSFLQGLFLFILSIKLYPVRLAAPVRPSDPIRATPGQILRFSFAAFITNFIFFAGARLCLYLLPYRIPPAGQGNYIQAYKIVEYMSLLMAVTYYPVIALVAGEGKEKMKERILFLVRLSNTFVLLSGLFILATGWWLFPFVFGPSFDRMYGIFIGFLPGLFAVCSSTFFTAYYFGAGLLPYNFISACIQFGCTPLFFFLFAKDGNVTGAAFAFSLASLASLGYDLFVFRRLHPYDLREVGWLRTTDATRIGGFIRKGSMGRSFFKR